MSQSKRHQSLRADLIDMRSELFAYQVRYDEVYEQVYLNKQDTESPNLVHTGLSSSTQEIAASKANDDDLIQERASRPDSLFPDTVLPISLARQGVDADQAHLPITIIIEPIVDDHGQQNAVRLLIENHAFPQILEFQLGLSAHTQSLDGTPYRLALPSGQVIDPDESIFEAVETIHAHISEQVWTYDIIIESNKTLSKLSWLGFSLYIADLDGEVLGEYDYQMGQISQVLLSPRSIF